MQRLDCGLTEVKFVAGETEEMTFSGYGAVFGNIDSYGDMIQKSAFAATLREAKKTGQWPAMLMQHGGWGMGADDMTPVGIWSSMEEDDIGLKVGGKFADTARGREAYALLKMSPRPAITGLSIGYIAKEWIQGTKPEEPRRTLKKIELLEVSLVTFPANPKARIQSVKSGLTIRAAEQALREVGFSQSEAKAILADGFKSISSRDAGDLGDLAELIRRNTATLTH